MFKGAWASVAEIIDGFLWPFTQFGNLSIYIRRLGPARFIKAIEPVVILLAIVGFMFEITDRREERTARAWQLVVAKAPGNSGKIQALEYLNSQDPDWLLGWWLWAKRQTLLIEIDLTPPDLADKWKGKEKASHIVNLRDCPNTTFLVGVQLPNAVLNGARLPCANLTSANLRGAKLNRANLSGARLFKTNLKGAVLIQTNLVGAHILKTDLSGVDLGRAKLIKARLIGINFSEANLRGADLSEANLRGAYLRGADLREANLTGADLRAARLKGANISQAQIETARPSAPPKSLPDGREWPFEIKGGKWVRKK